MDNNFNMQQNNAQQPMYQQAPQQQMYQQPMGQQAPQQQMYQQPMGQQAPQQMYQQPMYNNQYQQPKKNTGLIIGIIVGIVALIAIIVTIVLVLVLGGDKDKDKEGGSSTKNYLIGTWESEDGVEMTFNKDNTGELYGMDIEWSKSGDTLTIKINYSGFEYEEEYTIADLSKDTMVLENEDGDEMEFTKID